MINVGIIGCGFVGGALKDWLEHNNPECKLFISDPPKGYNDDLSNIDIAFLQIHVPTEDDGTQDLTLIKQLITNLPDVPVFVRTTINSFMTHSLGKCIRLRRLSDGARRGFFLNNPQQIAQLSFFFCIFAAD